MQLNDTIILDDNKKYLLLQETEEKDDKYFLAIGLNEDEKPDFEDMVIFKEIEDIDGIYVESISDEKLISRLTKVFEEKLKEEEKNNGVKG